MTTYWRFTCSWFGIGGEVCGPCAWIIAYQYPGQWRTIHAHESSKLLIVCARCHRTMWTVASHTLPVVAA